MSLQQWVAHGWLKAEPASAREIGDPWGIVRRDLADARGDVSADSRFGIAYNAALKLCTILLRAEGYRPSHSLQHYRTLQAMPLILGEHRAADAAYLDACRIKRHKVEYVHASRYQLYLPTEDELREELEREREDAERTLRLSAAESDDGEG